MNASCSPVTSTAAERISAPFSFCCGRAAASRRASVLPSGADFVDSIAMMSRLPNPAKS